MKFTPARINQARGDSVARPVSALSPGGLRVLQRKCDCGKSSSTGECEECKKKKEGVLQRFAIRSQPS
jgi:hypothetical protein